jgi:hypothetical protein
MERLQFLSALLTAHSNVAQGFAEGASNETGILRPYRVAHADQLSRLEWLLSKIGEDSGRAFTWRVTTRFQVT